jgi:hypothetical protein
MSKYSVGDKVKVRADLKNNQAYGFNVAVTEMVHLAGQIVTISQLTIGGSQYRIKEDKECYMWTEQMFKDVPLSAVDRWVQDGL